jgi:rubrerythrin
VSKTKDNLAAAFAGESQANRRYLAFAAQAAKEGHPAVARLFRAVAEAETVHALSHLRSLGEVGTTAENLKAAIAGEHHEFKEMYPAMIAEAKAEGEKAAERSFTYANEVEQIHHGLYEAALKKVEQGQGAGQGAGGAEVAFYSVCSVCGYTHEGEAPETCPVCKAGKKAFFKVE